MKEEHLRQAEGLETELKGEVSRVNAEKGIPQGQISGMNI